MCSSDLEFGDAIVIKPLLFRAHSPPLEQSRTGAKTLRTGSLEDEVMEWLGMQSAIFFPCESAGDGAEGRNRN